MSQSDINGLNRHKCLPAITQNSIKLQEIFIFQKILLLCNLITY